MWDRECLEAPSQKSVHRKKKIIETVVARLKGGGQSLHCSPKSQKGGRGSKNVYGKKETSLTGRKADELIEGYSQSLIKKTKGNLQASFISIRGGADFLPFIYML